MRSERYTLLILAICFIFVVAIVCAGPAGGQTPVSPLSLLAEASCRIAIDINPSIELQLVEGRVHEAAARNDDGRELLLTADVIGLSAEQAIRTILREMIDQGYLDGSELEPHLLVAVTGSSTRTGEVAAAALGQVAREELAGQTVECQVDGAYIPDDVAAAASGHGLTAGRYIVLASIAQSQDLTIDETIALYGDLKIGEMFDLFDGARDAFKAYCQQTQPDDVSSGNDGHDGLTAEQLAVRMTALAVYRLEIATAGASFNERAAAILADCEAKAAAIKAAGGPADVVQQEMKMIELRRQVLDERREAIIDLNNAICQAKREYIATAVANSQDAATADSELDSITEAEIDTASSLRDLLDFFNPRSASQTGVTTATSALS